MAAGTYAPIAGVQFQVDGVNLGAEVNTHALLRNLGHHDRGSRNAYDYRDGA